MIEIAIELIESKIARLYKERLHLREVCDHGDCQVKHRSDTGNWCRADDKYWTEYKCNICGKQWDKQNGNNS